MKPIIATAALLLFAVCGWEDERNSETSQVTGEIFNGTQGVSSPYGHVKVGGCSGTLVSNQWALTAKHCWLDGNGNFIPANWVVVTYEHSVSPTQPHGSHSDTVGVELVYHHPTRDATLMRLATPIAINGFGGHLNTLFPGLDADLVSKPIHCWGYGNNAYDSQNTPVGAGTLRYAALEVNGAADGFLQVYPQNSQQFFYGDSGTSCFYVSTTGAPHQIGVFSWGIPDPPNPPPYEFVDGAHGIRTWLTQTMMGSKEVLADGATWLKPSAVTSTEAASGDKYVELFVTGTDGHVYSRYALLNPDTTLSDWTPYYLLTQASTGVGPSVVAYGNEAYLFVTDSNLRYRKRFSNYALGDWVNLGNHTPIGSAPAAVNVNDQEIWVFVRGTDGRLKYRKVPQGQWSQSWQAPFGTSAFTHDPSAVYLSGTNKIYVFARTTGGNISYKSYDRGTGTWSGWATIAGFVASGPAAVVRGPRRIDLFARNNSNQLMSRTFYDGAWSSAGWITHATTSEIAASPFASSRGDNAVDIFVVRSVDGSVERQQTPW
jgi:hypothetical protein